jgi:hypothetical protein
VVVGGIAGAALVFDMRVALNPGAQFDEARARWQAADIDSYTLFVEVQAPFQTSGVYELTVQDGELTDAVVYNPPTFRFDPNAPAFDVPVSQGAPYTLEALFDRAARLQQDFAPLHIYTAGTSHVRYDEDDGYVTELVDNTCGWLTLAAECVTRIRVIRFDPLSTSSLQFPHDRTIVMGQNYCIYRAEVCH